MMDFLFNRTPLYFMTQSLWRDEAFSYLLAQKSIIDIIRLTAQDFNPPFYYIMLHFWISIFGKSEIALRSLSFVFFALTLYDVLQSIGILFTGYESFFEYYNYFIVVLSLFLTLVVIILSIRHFHHHRKKSDLFVLLALWSFLFYIGTLIVSFFIPIFLFRYLIFAPVGFILFLSYLLERTARRTFLILITILYIVTIHYTALESLYKKKGDVRKTIREIKTIAGKNDLIYVADPTLYFTT